MKIGMYLGRSKYWWAWLGIRSNPAIAEAAHDFEYAVFFDDLRHLPPQVLELDRRRAKYFCIFWDGIRAVAENEEVRLALGPGADLTALVVGEEPYVLRSDPNAMGLYPEGPMSFSVIGMRLDFRTSAILLGARIKALLMPLKNVMQSKGRRSETAMLLWGECRIVFCGSYGTTPQAIAELCARNSIDQHLFDGYEYFCNEGAPSFDRYRQCLRTNGLFLARLYDRSAISAGLLHSAVHLLGRGYFIEKLRSVSTRIFIHGYTAGGNINVYTTPWYRQHLFLDFGSTVGPGNYPRLADLQYFRKKFVEIDLSGEADELAAAARSGELETRWEAEWKQKWPLLLSGASSR